MFSPSVHSQPVDGFNEPDLGGGRGLVEAFTPEMKEKMMRLEKQNQILRKRVENAESATPVESGGCGL